MSHIEAQRLLHGIMQANFEQALAEAQGTHRHEEPLIEESKE
jgi:hypothetical protein